MGRGGGDGCSWWARQSDDSHLELPSYSAELFSFQCFVSGVNSACLGFIQRKQPGGGALCIGGRVGRWPVQGRAQLSFKRKRSCANKLNAAKMWGLKKKKRDPDWEVVGEGGEMTRKELLTGRHGNGLNFCTRRSPLLNPNSGWKATTIQAQAHTVSHPPESHGYRPLHLQKSFWLNWKIPQNSLFTTRCYNHI